MCLAQTRSCHKPALQPALPRSITYNLGSKKDESMEWFDVALAESIGDPQKSFYNQTHEKIDLRRHSDTRAGR